MIFETRNLTVRYPGADRPALAGVSLGVAPGELVVVAGPNGSGKTTLIRALLGGIEREAGDALVNGRAVADWPRAELARWIGVVIQREELWVPFTVEEVVQMGRYPRLGPLAPLGLSDRAVVDRAMERCDVSIFRGRLADSLSGGEWQRVRIARALAQEPRALVLDEPGNALDIRHEMEVMELIAALVADGLACLLISHHLNLAARYADRVVLLDQGRIVASGTPSDVLREPVLTGVFRWPLAVRPWRDGTPQLVPLRPGDARDASDPVEPNASEPPSSAS